MKAKIRIIQDVFNKTIPQKTKTKQLLYRETYMLTTLKLESYKAKQDFLNMYQHCFLLIRELTFLGLKLFLHEGHSSLQKLFSPYLKIALKFLLPVLQNGLSLLENGFFFFIDDGFFINCYFLKTVKRCSTVLCYCRPGCEGRFLVVWQLLESGHMLSVLVIIRFYKVTPNSAALLQQH